MFSFTTDNIIHSESITKIISYEHVKHHFFLNSQRSTILDARSTDESGDYFWDIASMYIQLGKKKVQRECTWGHDASRCKETTYKNNGIKVWCGAITIRSAKRL